MKPRALLPLLCASAACAALAGFAFADDSGYGVVSPSGSVFTTEVFPAGDVDAYTFQGYPGMVLTATVKPTKGSSFVPSISVVRPGGVPASDRTATTGNPAGAP